jgi:hypothetical protein
MRRIRISRGSMMNLFHVLKGVGGQVMERAVSQWRTQLPASYEKAEMEFGWIDKSKCMK